MQDLHIFSIKLVALVDIKKIKKIKPYFKPPESNQTRNSLKHDMTRDLNQI